MRVSVLQSEKVEAAGRFLWSGHDGGPLRPVQPRTGRLSARPSRSRVTCLLWGCPETVGECQPAELPANSTAPATTLTIHGSFGPQFADWQVRREGRHAPAAFGADPRSVFS